MIEDGEPRDSRHRRSDALQSGWREKLRHFLVDVIGSGVVKRVASVCNWMHRGRDVRGPTDRARPGRSGFAGMIVYEPSAMLVFEVGRFSPGWIRLLN